MNVEAIFAYSLAVILVAPFFIGMILVIWWYKTLLLFHHKVKKINPDLAFRFFPFFKPRKDFRLLNTYGLGFKVIWLELSFGFLSKKKRDKSLDEFFNILAVSKLKNPELNKLIKKLKRIFTLYSYWLMGYWLFILVMSILLFIIFKWFPPFS